MDFTHVPTVTSVQESKAGFAARAAIATQYNACRPKDLGRPQPNQIHPLRGDEKDFITVAIARLEFARHLQWCGAGPQGPGSPRDLIQSVNDGLVSQTDNNNWVLGTACPFGSGDKSVALAGLITLMYRYSPELQQDTYSTVRGPTTAYDQIKSLLSQAISGPPEPSTSTYDCMSVTFPETENHLLMIYTSRYLTNQLIDDNKPEHNNQKNGFDDWMLRYVLQPLLKNDFSEYNSRPYQTYAMMALQNLYDFACDSRFVTLRASVDSCTRVKTAAQMILDYVSAKFAVSSSSLRRFAPYRRRRSHYDTSLFDPQPRDGAESDPQTFRFMVLAGMPRDLGYGYNGEAGGTDVQQAAVTTYRIPDLILDLIVNSADRSYYQRFHHAAAEVYAGSPQYLITGGGKWIPSPHSDNCSGPIDFICGDQYPPAYEDVGLELPTTLMPSKEGMDAADFIQIGTIGRIPNLCVAPGFACGAYILIPQSYLAEGCFTVLDGNRNPSEKGPWWFIDASGNCLHGKKLGVYIAIYSKNAAGLSPLFEYPDGQYPRVSMEASMAENPAMTSPGAAAFVPGSALFEVAASAGMNFETFWRTVLRNNPSFSFDNNFPPQENVYTTVSAIKIGFVGGALFSNRITSIYGFPEDTSDPLAQGDIINSCEHFPCQPGDGHNGFLRITNPTLGKRLVFDFTDFSNPRRSEECFGGSPGQKFWGACPAEGERPQASPNSGAFAESGFYTHGEYELLIGSGDYVLHYKTANNAAGAPWLLGEELQPATTIIRGTGGPVPSPIGPNGYAPSVSSNSPEDSGAVPVPTAPPISGQPGSRSLPKSQPSNTGYAVEISAQPTGMALIQSNIGNDPGDLVAVVRMSPKRGSPSAASGDYLVMYELDSLSGQWQGPDTIIAGGQAITGVTGTPALIQSSYGAQGNFELLVPQGGHVVHYWRNNDDLHYVWNRLGAIDGSGVVSRYEAGTNQAVPTGVALIHSAVGRPGDLVAIVRMSPQSPLSSIGNGGSDTSDYLVTYVLDSASRQWRGPTPIVLENGQRITGVTGNPVAIEDRGTPGMFELFVPQGDQIGYYRRKKNNGIFRWGREGTLGGTSSNASGGSPRFGVLRETPIGVGLIQANIGSPGDFVVAVRISRVAPASTSGGGGVAVAHQGEFTTSTVPDYMVMYVFDSASQQWHGPTSILIDGKPISGVTAF